MHTDRYIYTYYIKTQSDFFFCFIKIMLLLSTVLIL